MSRHHWWGIVGPQPLPNLGGLIVTPHDSTRRLRPTTLGDLVLGGADQPLTEWRRGDPRSLDSVEQFESWPVIVQASTEASTRHAAQQTASEVLHRVALLLALAWDEPWQERTSPQNPTQLPPRAPESWPPPPFAPSPAMPPVAIDAALPTWADTAWEQLNEHVTLRNAASFWHQGLLASPGHPSLALVAFVASIEGLAGALQAAGDEIPDHRRCSCGETATGAAARFRAACRLVAPEEDVRTLSRLYTLRSQSAHGSALHGTEDAAGTFFSFTPAKSTSESDAYLLLPDASDQRQDFALRALAGARRVARQLLLRLLTAPQQSS